jgi:hypothetical protein
MIIITASKKDKTELQDSIELISKLKSELKENDIALEICKEYGHDIDIIDGLAIEFADSEEVDASAKTINARIFLNKKLMDGPFENVMRYALHEFVHSLQHMERSGTEDPYVDCEYLERPDEVEAFQFQIKYEDDVRGEDRAHEYIDDLLDYHEIPSGKKEDKKEELLGKVDD